MIHFVATICTFLFSYVLLIVCGGKKKNEKGGSGEKPAGPPAPVNPVKADSSRPSQVPTELKSKVPEAGKSNEKDEKGAAGAGAADAKPAAPPKPAIPDTKMAEMMPESAPKSDEMKEGIKLPHDKTMKCEAEEEERKAAKKRSKEGTKTKKSAEDKKEIM
uniref:Uncharacterized protein n=1 Tax=Caenorhabditis japonica TaxID=281687 RepID=A0A8R1I033_CAEJA